jgi:hypothetical protein
MELTNPIAIAICWLRPSNSLPLPLLPVRLLECADDPDADADYAGRAPECFGVGIHFDDDVVVAQIADGPRTT